MDITESARVKIREINREKNLSPSLSKLKITLVWMYNTENERDGGYPNIGAVDEWRIPASESPILSFDGIDIYNGLPDELIKIYRDYTLGFAERRFFFKKN